MNFVEESEEEKRSDDGAHTERLRHGGLFRDILEGVGKKRGIYWYISTK